MAQGRAWMFAFLGPTLSLAPAPWGPVFPSAGLLGSRHRLLASPASSPDISDVPAFCVCHLTVTLSQWLLLQPFPSLLLFQSRSHCVPPSLAGEN